MTGALGAKSLEPPPDPYGRPPVTSVTLIGPVGPFAIHAGIEVRVGRDAGQCAVALNEPRVSGVHATLKVEQGRLWARDEQSNNGTFIGGERLAPGQWVAVQPGQTVRFGPLEFSARFEA